MNFKKSSFQIPSFNFDSYAEKLNNLNISYIIKKLNKDTRFSIVPYCYFAPSYWQVEDRYNHSLKTSFYPSYKELDRYGNYINYNPDIEPNIDISNLHACGEVCKIIVPEYVKVIKHSCGIKENIDKNRLKIAGIIGVPVFNEDKQHTGHHFVSYVLDSGVLHYFDINGYEIIDLQFSPTTTFQFTIICKALREAFDFEYFSFYVNKTCFIPKSELDYSVGNIYQDALINSWNLWFINKKLHNNSLFDIDKQFDSHVSEKLNKKPINKKAFIENYMSKVVCRLIPELI